MEACEQKGFYKRGKLPHFDQLGEVQFITYRLADSLPSAALQRAMDLPKAKQTPRILQLLDAGYGECHLRDPRIANIVQSNLLHFDGQRYGLLAWAIMPNHVHVLIDCNVAFPLSKIIQSWKSYTANEANKILGRRGQFYQDDYFDRAARSQEEVVTVAKYIEYNPVASGLVQRVEDWPYSSAGYRGAPCW